MRWLALLVVMACGGPVAKPQTLTLAAAGLWLGPSDLGKTPPGAMSEAEDIVISREGEVEPRRGHTVLASQYLARIIPYRQNLLGWGDGKLWYGLDGMAWSELGALADIAGDKLHWAEAGRNLYLNGYPQTLALERPDGTPRPAGLPSAVDPSDISGASGDLVAAGAGVAYRVVYGYRDENDNLHLSAPSGRVLYINSGAGAVDVTLGIPIAHGLPDGAFLQIYRTPIYPSASITDQPPETYYLVHEQEIVGTTSIIHTDTTPDAFAGAALYTNPEQEGALNANAEPPVAEDLAAYRGCLFYANVGQRSRLFASLLGVGTGGLEDGDDFVLAVGSTALHLYADATATNVETGHFKITLPAGGYTSAEAIADAAHEIVRVVNFNSAFAQRARAYYVSPPDERPGQILFEARYPEEAVSISYGAGVSSFFSPSDPTAPVDIQRNLLMWSKPQEPEAVPLLNYAAIGSADAEILRIIPTRNFLAVFKEDGLWLLSGDVAPWTITPFDPTCILRASDSAVMLDNSIFALTNQGVVRVTDAGVSSVSWRQIDPEILPLLAHDMLGTTQGVSFGVAYESYHKYYLWVPTLAGESTGSRGYVYDLFTKTWTRDSRDLYHAVVNPVDDRLYLSSSGDRVLRERKDFLDTDYADGTDPIHCRWTFTPHFGATPGLKHHFTGVTAIFRSLGVGSFTLRFWTDLVTTHQAQAIDVSGFGTLPLGPTTVRTYVPREASRGSELYAQVDLPVLNQSFRFQGLGLLVRPTGQEAGR